jgi:hypothetical protein
MNETIIIPALLRLFEYASIRRFNIKDKNINFEDEIGQEAISINNKLKTTQGLDIFDENLKSEDLTKYEHLLGNAMSNHVNKKVVLRKVNDEIKVLKEAKAINPKLLKKHRIQFSLSLKDFINNIKTINSENLLKSVQDSTFLSLLERDEQSDNYFTQTNIKINNKDYFLISILLHEDGIRKNLFITNIFILEQDKYLKFGGNPIQLFLKGLDKYGIDMNINDTLSRYYNWIEVPLNTNIQSQDFLNLQNIGPKDSFILSMILKHTLKSIVLQNVFATRTNLILTEFNE